MRPTKSSNSTAKKVVTPVETKPVVKTVETPAAEVKAVEAKVVEAAKTVEQKAEAGAKEVVKKTATRAKKAVDDVKKAVEEVKKPAAKKAAEPKANVVIEYADQKIEAKKVLEAAKKAFTKANPDKEIKTIDIYVKPEEGVAYYVVNGEGSDDYKVVL